MWLKITIDNSNQQKKKKSVRFCIKLNFSSIRINLFFSIYLICYFFTLSSYVDLNKK